MRKFYELWEDGKFIYRYETLELAKLAREEMAHPDNVFIKIR